VTLVLNRIDDRLIHGQVVVGWGQPLDVRFIVLVDDAVASSDWERELYRMGVPPEMELRFHSAAEAARHAADKGRSALVVTGGASGGD
jgi:PTS system mannose-specific IIB component/fructoselysine and glucoselysine-specific PTS system IIB component